MGVPRLIKVSANERSALIIQPIDMYDSTLLCKRSGRHASRPGTSGFQYLRTAADVQGSRIASVFGDIVREQGLDPSILETNAQQVLYVYGARDCPRVYHIV